MFVSKPRRARADNERIGPFETPAAAVATPPLRPPWRPPMTAPPIDRVARRIAAALQRDGRQSAQQLAEGVGLSATPVWRRVKELEASGVIRGYVALLDREKLGLSICVLAHVTLVRHSEGAVEQFEAMARA